MVTIINVADLQDPNDPPAAILKEVRPTHDGLIKYIAQSYGVSTDTACDWILETAESLKVTA